MKGKRVLFSFILLIILGSGVYPLWKYLIHKSFTQWVEGLTFAQGEGSKTISNPGDIVEIKIKNPSGSMTFEKDQNENWYVTAPIHARANPFVADMPLKILSIDEKELVEQNPQDLTKYYLDNPDIEIQFRIKNSNKWHSLRFGRRSPTGSLYYTYNPDKKKVFLTEFGIKFDFNGDYDYYMNKVIFPNSPFKSNRAVFEFPDQTFEYVFEDNIYSWMMERPIKGKVHQQSFPSFLSGLEKLRALKFLEPGEVPQDTGFDHPILTMTFSKTGKWAQTLFIGNISQPGVRYAKLADSPTIFLVPENIADATREKLGKVNSYLACYFPQFGVMRIEFITGDISFAFSREDKTSKVWQFEGRPDARVDYGAVVNIIYKLYNSQNKGYIGVTMPGAPAQYGFNKPRMTIKMDFDNPHMTNLTHYYGNKDPSGKFIYNYNSQDPGILKTDAELEAVFPKSGEELLLNKK